MFSWDFSRFRESIIILEKVGSNQFSPSATHVQIARKVFRIFQSNQARNFAGSLNQLQLKSTSIHALSDLASVKSLLFARYVNESFQTSWSRSIRVALCVSFFVCSNAALLGQLVDHVRSYSKRSLTFSVVLLKLLLLGNMGWNRNNLVHFVITVDWLS